MVIEGDQKVILVTLLIATKNVWPPINGDFKMGFGHHSKNLDY
jgi:hypothetical protein